MSARRLMVSTIAVTALLPLIAACGDDESPDASDAPTNGASLPEGVLALPAPDESDGSATLTDARYRIDLDDSLSFDVDVTDPSYAHDDGLYVASGPVVLKTEVAGPDYGLPRDPCTDHTIVPAGTTVDDFVDAVLATPGYGITTASPARIGDAVGRRVEFRLPASYDGSACASDTLLLPGTPASAVTWAPPVRGHWWVLDVDGQRVAIQQNCGPCTRATLDAATEIVESITFTRTD